MTDGSNVRSGSSAAKCLDPTVCNYPNGRCVEPSRCTYPKSAAPIGRAVLVCIDIDAPHERGAMWEGPFEERDGDERHAHPIARAWALWESIKDDWPGMRATVIANDRAKNLQAAYRMESMGFDYAESLHAYENEGGVAGAPA